MSGLADLRGAAEAAVRSLRYAGVDALREFAARTYLTARPDPPADPVLAADWDVLVVLDACRADLMAEVLDETARGDRFESRGTATSPASTSAPWMERVFGEADDEELAGLGYVSGNPHTASAVDGDRFGLLDEVWRYAWDDDLGTIPPAPVTDRAIATWRGRDLDRLVVHYMQPHFPSVADPSFDEGVPLAAFGDRPMSVWERLRFGRVSEAEVWEQYRANLRAVLDSVAVLFENLDADRAVVTADHGNAVGEWHLYGHVGGVSLPSLRTVPWCVARPVDRHTRDPESYDRAGEAASDVDERLQQLGYR
ncbi:MAG: hypothetical protein ABEJ08_05220 [Halobacteriaceae archaeon]